MDYPFWDTGIGYGILMASIAITHVFISHFAIGGGLYLVVSEVAARRRGDAYRLQYLRRLAKFFALVSLVVGALTGVGIWFIIGLLNPAATAALIHTFVWAWAIEWTFFAAEITAALVYVYGWDRLSPRDHERVGWIYFVSAWMSLFVINGILTFMLTPGRWLETGAIAHGFFNPGYWPALVFRTGICVLLAGVYGNAVAARLEPSHERDAIVRRNSAWILAGVIVIVPSWFWFWGALPDELTRTVLERMREPVHSIAAARGWLAALAALTLVVGVAMPRRMGRVVAVVSMVLALGFFGRFEFAREMMRKPWVIWGVMYGNGVDVARLPEVQRDGLLAHLAWRTGDDEADVFRRACRSCHTIDGYRPLAPAFAGTSPDFIADIARAAHQLRGNMPPFAGDDEDATRIARWIWARVDHTPVAERARERGLDAGAEAWRVYCGKCHEFGGFRDVSETLAGLEDEDFDDLFENGPDYGEGMPVFTLPSADREALVGYIRRMTEEVQP